MTKLTTITTVTAATALMLGLTSVSLAQGEARIAGQDRYDTSVKIAQQYFAKAQTVLLTTGMNFPDALAAGPLAAKEKAPILLVGTTLTKTQLEYLQSAQPKTVLIIGGTKVLPASLEKEIGAIKGIKVERVAGTDRYDTAQMIAKKFSQSQDAYVASGMNFPDALAGGAHAARLGRPLLLTAPGHSLTLSGNATIFGGLKAVPDGLVKANGKVERVYGNTRYETAAQIAKLRPAKSGFLASGQNFPDALSIVPVAGMKDMPLLLASQSCSPAKTDLPVTLVGGPKALADGASKACVATQSFTYAADGSNGKGKKIEELISWDLAVKTVRNYYGAGADGIANKTSSRYIDDVTQIAAAAAPKIAKACTDAKAAGKKPAAVFDSDDTTLWTYDMEDAGMGFHFTPAKQEEWFKKHQLPATPGMVPLVKQLHAAGCEIFGLTGRNDAQKDYTVKNLEDAGYVDQAGKPLFQKDKFYTKFLKDKPMPQYLMKQGRCDQAKNKCTTVQFKAGTREHIQKDLGYTIVGNFGDQWSDLMGGQAENWVKLPNPTYYLPSPNLPEWEAKDTAAGMQPKTYTWTIATDGSTGSQMGIRDYQLPNIDMVKAALKAQKGGM